MDLQNLNTQPQTPNEPAPAVEDASIPRKPIAPLQTFQTDIERFLKENEVSEKDLKVAELLKQRVGSAPIPVPPTPSINPQSVLLPNQEVHSPLNATRTNAGTLLGQEASATLPKPPPPSPLIEKKPDSVVRPIETYQDDVARYVQEKKVSAVTIAVAEDARRTPNTEVPEENSIRSFIQKSVVVFFGLLFIGGAVGALAYVHYTKQALPAHQEPSAPFIRVDTITPVVFSTGDTRKSILTALTTAKENTRLSSGLIAQLLPSIATSSETLPIGAQTFFNAMTPNIPQTLLRNLRPSFLLGVHALTSNKPFLILSVDSYESGYAGMLAWEDTLAQDLSPLFPYTPPPVYRTEVASSTASTTVVSPVVIQTGFTDTIIENHDARTLAGTDGAPQIMWTFIDRNTVLIATDVRTVEEIVSRLTIAPIKTSI